MDPNIEKFWDEYICIFDKIQSVDQIAEKLLPLVLTYLVALYWIDALENNDYPYEEKLIGLKNCAVKLVYPYEDHYDCIVCFYKGNDFKEIPLNHSNSFNKYFVNRFRTIFGEIKLKKNYF